MKYRVYCGMLGWFIDVEADTEEAAIRKAKQQAFSRLDNDGSWWGIVDNGPEKPSTGPSGE